MSRSMRCVDVRNRLPLVPGDELLRHEDAAVRSHLSACLSCRAELGQFVRARRALRTLTPVMRGEDDAYFQDLRDETLAAVRNEAATSRRSRRAAPRGRSMAGLMTAAALFLLGVYLVPQPEPYGHLPGISAIPVGPVRLPAHEVGGPRFQDVGYGLMGHEVRMPDPVPVGFDPAPPRRADAPAEAEPINDERR